MVNNTLAAVVLGPPLLYLTYPRVKEMGLLYADVMREEDVEPFSFSQPTIAALGLVVVAIAWLVLGVYAFSPQTTMQMALGAVGFALLVLLALLASQGLPEQLRRTGAR
jgi:energy-coupling factor transport system substrate-specific component